MFVFIGAPYVERLRGNPALSSALTGITAAVVGVIGSLAAVLLFRLKWSVLRTLGICAAVGVASAAVAALSG